MRPNPHFWGTVVGGNRCGWAGHWLRRWKRRCRAEATHHVVWNVEGVHSLVCDRHVRWLIKHHVFYALHPVGEVCLTLHPTLDECENRCLI